MHKIIYFSGTGNTAYIAKHIEKQLIGLGFEVNSQPVELANPKDMREFNCLYIGFPIYACDMPGPCRDFIDAMPDGKGSRVKLFATKAYFSGQAMLRAAERLENKGWDVLSTFERKMPGTDGLAFLKKDGSAAKKLLSNFDGDLSDVDAWACNDEKTIRKRKSPDISGKLVWVLLKVVEGGIKKKYLADSRCTSCGKCSRICPVGNIRLVDGEVKFGNKCILCMRCIHQCPVEAIQIGKATAGKLRYKGPAGDFRPVEKTGKRDG